MMVSYPNGSLSGEASNKRPLENGFVPKYKPRKVSAIRDFPPMCGPNALANNIKPEENGCREARSMEVVCVTNLESGNAVVANGAGVSGVSDLKEAEAVGNSGIQCAELNGTKDPETRDFVGPTGVENSIIEVGCQSHEAVNSGVDVDATKSLDTLVEEVKVNVNASKKLVMEIAPLRIHYPDDFELCRHEAVYNAVEMEGDQSLDSYIGKVTTATMNGFSKEVEELVPETGIKPETSSRPRDKYRPRRVSAFRDFPPHCGTHVTLPVEEEKQMIVSGNDHLNRTEKVGLAPEAAMPRNMLERGTVEEELMTSQKGCVEGLINIPVENGTTETLKEIVVHSPDTNDKKGPQHNEYSLETDSNRVIVHGLMAEPNSIFKKSKVDGGESGQRKKKPNSSRREKPKDAASECNLKAQSSSPEKTALPDTNDVDGSPNSLANTGEGAHSTYDEGELPMTPISMAKDVNEDIDNDYVGPVGNDIIAYSPGGTDEMMPLHDVAISEDEAAREVVHGLVAVPHCPSRKGKTVTSNLKKDMNSEKRKKQNMPWRKKGKAVAKKSTPKVYSSGSASKKKNKVHTSNDVGESPGDLMLADDLDHELEGESPANSSANHKTQDVEVNLPPFGPTSSGNTDDRNKVRETLRFFHAIYRKLLQQEETQSKPEEEGNSHQSGKKLNRIDLMTAKVLKEKGKFVNPGKKTGALPGIEVGDEFQYRVELAVVGIHFPFQSGIDSTKVKGVSLATSIVASGGYSDNLDDADVLIYSGQGGNVVGNNKSKEAEDQKLERGNLALKNCIDARSPVRVVRGWKESKYVDPLDSRPKLVTTYIYDGLYTVTRFWTEKGPRGKQVFQFELKRNPGQPELAWKELKKSSKFKTRPGTCVADISGGKETIPISAVNTLNDEKPPAFNYIPKMMYPGWYRPTPPAGCDCTGRCSSSKKCRCAVANGGEIPYNRNGALVETKALVYECGPHCKCPPSCYNRASQRGIKFKLEIFKTQSRGWGVRPLTSVPSGSFICEYAGELLEDREAEKKVGNDEYLFDIGQNYIDSSKPEEQEIAAELNEEGGFTIDACQYGNVGRFINHSCSPNLHAQNVIYDHDDKRMPHIMLFAMENIPPLQELTYHYNYAVNQVYDSDGNIKVKKCYCGTAQCTGRMY